MTRISYSQRNFNPEYACKDASFSITRPYETLGKEETVFNDRIVKTSAWKTVDPVESFRGVLASDYSLDNILAAGAVNMLRECRAQMNTRGEMCDYAEPGIEALSERMESQDNNIQDNEQ